jgi:hypothetical protein
MIRCGFSGESGKRADLEIGGLASETPSTAATREGRVKCVQPTVHGEGNGGEHPAQLELSRQGLFWAR